MTFTQEQIKKLSEAAYDITTLPDELKGDPEEFTQKANQIFDKAGFQITQKPKESKA